MNIIRPYTPQPIALGCCHNYYSLFIFHYLLGTKKKNPDKHKLIEVHKNGGYLLSRAQDGLPSAMLGLTSLFGMGRGGTPAP